MLFFWQYILVENSISTQRTDHPEVLYLVGMGKKLFPCRKTLLYRGSAPTRCEVKLSPSPFGQGEKQGPSRGLVRVGKEREGKCLFF